MMAAVSDPRPPQTARIRDRTPVDRPRIPAGDVSGNGAPIQARPSVSAAIKRIATSQDEGQPYLSLRCCSAPRQNMQYNNSPRKTNNTTSNMTRSGAELSASHLGQQCSDARPVAHTKVRQKNTNPIWHVNAKEFHNAFLRVPFNLTSLTKKHIYTKNNMLPEKWPTASQVVAIVCITQSLLVSMSWSNMNAVAAPYEATFFQ